MEKSISKDQNEFELLDLSYMKQVSRGDTDYEKKVTRLFIEIIPENLANLQRDFELRAYPGIKKTLHHMQSSIAVMGLDNKLGTYMDMDLYERVNSKQVKENIDFISEICNKAVEEAKQYLITLNGDN